MVPDWHPLVTTGHKLSQLVTICHNWSQLVTTGHYRSLVKRFVGHRRPKARSVSVADYDGGGDDDDDDGSAMAMSALLWRPDDWLCA